MADHFDKTQTRERKLINELFDNFFRINNCSYLNITSKEDKNPIDAVFISGTSTHLKPVAVEIKRRNISITLYPDCVIDHHKWIALREFHKAGHLSFYIIAYQEFIAVWCLSDIFNIEPNPDFGFNPTYATENCANYKKGEKLKNQRGLEFWRCSYFLDYDFNKLTLSEMNSRLIASQNS